ncbi:MAG: hypothetical protein AVDCRST_MAG53-2317 [uncultured Solirubrobacteraceae bacterium]|uniref:Uncharacterized protein n=1 Tax=uncultured Solirubrobacteraceae bacterium TaxID=1162706 RepID=A0A6J4SSG3_9ACTN|nr:MAG: hypothetical protein AVDCRST_MAG53-2317 [uncultured Solirubrobacteraceae bacterium]
MPAEAGAAKAVLAATHPTACGLDERCGDYWAWSINIGACRDRTLDVGE